MKKVIRFFFILFPCLLTLSCNEENGGNDGNTPILSVVVKDALPLYEVAAHQSTNLELTVTANPTSEEAYTITLSVKPDLVATYNAKNGTDYLMLPAAAYFILSTQVMLPRYSAKSTTWQVRLMAEGCEQGKTYLLPVAIESVKGGTNFEAPDDKAAYILFKVIAAETDGDGSQSKPFIIRTTDDVLMMNSLLKEDATTYFKMMDDVDFAEIVFSENNNPWVPVNYAVAEESASSSDAAVAAAEKRKIFFDGNNHKISNLKAGGGLFGILVGTVQNLTIEGADITCLMGNAGGVLAGIGGAGSEESGKVTGEAIVKNVTIKSSSLENDYKRTGGLIGWLKGGTIENVDVECSVFGSQQVGGLIGRVSAGTINNCSASGDAATENYYVGGLIGLMLNATVKNCHASGKVTHNPENLPKLNWTRAGGLVGQIDGNATIEKCYATGNVSGTGHFGGGLLGSICTDGVTVNIKTSYATGNVSLPTDGNFSHAGGLVGTLNASSTLNIENCYSRGSITVRRYSGGFVGTIYDKPGTINITNGYSTADLTGVGLADRCGIVIGNNFQDNDNPASHGTVNCTGFIAWDVSDRPFCYPADFVSLTGNYYGTSDTVSSQAAALGWSTDIWDLSGEYPTLK